MAQVNQKYEPAKLPATRQEAEALAAQYKEWAEQARAADRHGTAKEFELTQLLLEHYARTL